MYQILGLYRFPFGQEILYRPTYKWIEENTLKLRHVDFYKCIKFEFLSEFNWIERISFIKICIGWLLGIYCKDNLRAVLRVEICNGRSLLLLLDICTNVALISDSWKGTVRGGWGVGAKESRTAQKKTTATAIFKYPHIIWKNYQDTTFSTCFVVVPVFSWKFPQTFIFWIHRQISALWEPVITKPVTCCDQWGNDFKK